MSTLSTQTDSGALVDGDGTPDGLSAAADKAPVRSRRRRISRRIGTTLVALGVLALAYGATVYFWHDPITDLYARYKQHQLSGQLDDRVADYRISVGLPAESTPAGASAQTAPGVAASSVAPVATLAEKERKTRELARAYLASIEKGDPLGRIVIPRLDVNPIFINGTRWGADLSRGPGRYPETSLPGLGKVTAIAGHRTTFGAWFRHIDDLEAGDPITIDLPYGSFLYRVVGHEIVPNDDWSIIEPRGYDALVLSACHPLYSASQRYIVYAKLVKVDLVDGTSYRLPAQQAATRA